LTLVDTYFPFDTGPGNSATRDRWRSMARLFNPPGVVPGYANQCIPSIAGSQVSIGLGAMWIDGFYGEISTVAKTVTVTGPGQVVACMDPNDRSIKIFFRPGQNTPTQNLTGIYEIPLAQIAGTTTFTLTDIRQFALALKLPSHTVVAETLLRAAIGANTTSTAWTAWWSNLTFTKVRPDTLLDFVFMDSAWAAVAGGAALYAVQITAPNSSSIGQISRFYFNSAAEHHTIAGGIAGWGQELVNAKATGTVTFSVLVQNLATVAPHWYVDGNDWQFMRVIERMP